MRERSIILYPHEVRAALGGRLSLIVRPVLAKPPIPPECADALMAGDGSGSAKFFTRPTDGVAFARTGWIRCPLGAPGDRCWVRETWCLPEPGDDCAACYRATYTDIGPAGIDWSPAKTWRSPVLMPRKFSRLTVELTGVEARRVRSITFEETVDAGIDTEYDDQHIELFNAAEHACIGGLSCHCACPEMYPFVWLWDSRYAKRGLGWFDNPWSWFAACKVLEAK